MFPAKFQEALEVILYIALHSKEALVRGKDIASEKNLPPRHFEPILQLLAKERILKGTKGPKGGYCLAREKRKITLGEIYQMLLSQYVWDETTEIAKTIVIPMIKDYTSQVKATLDGKTIDDLCQNYNASDAEKQKINFAI